MQRYSRRLAHLIVAPVLILAACGKGEKANEDSSAALAADAIPQALIAQPAVGANRMPGTLAKSIDAYTGDEFYSFVRALKFGGGHDRQRKCKGDPGCGGTKPTKHTQVRIDAVDTQDSLAASNVPQFGVVYIRALNKGPAAEARYGLRTGSKYEYYMIVVAGATPGTMAWRLEELDTTPNARQHVQFGTGRFEGCQGHSYTPGARADFSTCDGARKSDSTMKMGLTLQGGADDLTDPMWATCSMGCCIGT